MFPRVATATAFEIFGVGLAVARYLTVVVTTLAALVFYRACRRSLPSHVAILIVLTVLVTASNFTFSRMALVDPVASAFSLMAVCIWILYRRSAAGFGIL